MKKFLFIQMFYLFLFLLFGQDSNAGIINEIINMSEKYYNEGNYKNAVDIYKEGIKKYPKDYSLHYYLGILHGKLNDYEKSENELKEALKLEPGNIEVIKELFSLECIRENYGYSAITGILLLFLDKSDAKINIGTRLYESYQKSIKIENNNIIVLAKDDKDNYANSVNKLMDMLNSYGGNARFSAKLPPNVIKETKLFIGTKMADFTERNKSDADIILKQINSGLMDLFEEFYTNNEPGRDFWDVYFLKVYRLIIDNFSKRTFLKFSDRNKNYIMYDDKEKKKYDKINNIIINYYKNLK